MLAHVPYFSLGTDIICGFPTETEEDFELTMRLVDKYRFPMVNISQFYPRPGTPAAKWKRVPTQQVKKRSSALTQLFSSYRCYDGLLGTVQRVWIIELDDKNNENMVGHTKGYVKVLLKRDD